MTHQADHEDFTLRYYRENPADLTAVRSAYGDAAHLCDAIAKDILAEHTKRRIPTLHGRELASAVRRVADAIWALREKMDDPNVERPEVAKP